jgi:hypothetical protein
MVHINPACYSSIVCYNMKTYLNSLMIDKQKNKMKQLKCIERKHYCYFVSVCHLFSKENKFAVCKMWGICLLDVHKSRNSCSNHKKHINSICVPHAHIWVGRISRTHPEVNPEIVELDIPIIPITISSMNKAKKPEFNSNSISQSLFRVRIYLRNLNLINSGIQFWYLLNS